jgi:hypothetical protein
MIIERDGYKIETYYECPPIPIRSHDWSAWQDGAEGPEWDGEGYIGGDPVGFGSTEEAAIEDLLEKLKERDSRED